MLTCKLKSINLSNAIEWWCTQSVACTISKTIKTRSEQCEDGSEEYMPGTRHSLLVLKYVPLGGLQLSLSRGSCGRAAWESPVR
jgi:hypothetical protein